MIRELQYCFNQFFFVIQEGGYEVLVKNSSLWRDFSDHSSTRFRVSGRDCCSVVFSWCSKVARQSLCRFLGLLFLLTIPLFCCFTWGTSFSWLSPYSLHDSAIRFLLPSLSLRKRAVRLHGLGVPSRPSLSLLEPESKDCLDIGRRVRPFPRMALSSSLKLPLLELLSSLELGETATWEC